VNDDRNLFVSLSLHLDKMMTKFSLTTFSLLLILFVEVILTAPPKEDASKLTFKQTPVSPSMAKVIISSMATPPFDAQGFLAQGAYYGGPRSSIAADNVLQQAMGWGMGLTTVQFPLNKLKSIEYVPGPPDDFTDKWNGGAYSMAYTCHTYGQSIVDKLNADCKNCGKTFLLGIVWGTFTGMNFDKDAIISAGCSVFEVTNNDNCFANFPSACSIRAVGQPIQLWDNVPTKISLDAKSRGQIISAIKQYASAKHQNIAVPPN